MSAVTTHVLDLSTGKPAAGVVIRLDRTVLVLRLSEPTTRTRGTPRYLSASLRLRLPRPGGRLVFNITDFDAAHKRAGTTRA